MNGDNYKKKVENKRKENKNMDEALSQVLESSNKEVTHYITYINFGILIALYHLEIEFAKEFKLAVITTAIFASLGLFIDYIHNQTYIWSSLNVLAEKNAEQKKIKYDRLHYWGKFFTILNIFTLVMAIFIFSMFIVPNNFFPCN